MNQTFYTGIVESRNDPLKIGRVKVRVHGLHTADKSVLPTKMLPWAEVMQPTVSGSGIGLSFGGLVNGTAVVLFFKDFWQQQPIVIGSLPGIAQADLILGAKTLDNKNKTVIASSTHPAPPVTHAQTPTQLAPGTANTVGSACDFTISQAGLNLIQGFEGLSLKSYYDVNGYAIGYGSHYADGVAVVAGQTCTKDQATKYLLQYVQGDITPTLCSTIQVKITQQMYDALCSLCYNIGTGNYKKSTVLKMLNASDYKGSATHFLDWNKSGGKVNPTLYARRQSESSYFLSGGIPSNV